MMHVFRPVRAAASRLLAQTHSGANSSVEFQQPPAFATGDSGGNFVVVQQPTTSAAPQHGLYDCMNVTNLPVIWPAHNVFTAPTSSQEGEWSAASGSAPPVEEPMLMASQAQPQAIPQQLPFLPAGSMIMLQPMPVLWPAFS